MQSFHSVLHCDKSAHVDILHGLLRWFEHFICFALPHGIVCTSLSFYVFMGTEDSVRAMIDEILVARLSLDCTPNSLPYLIASFQRCFPETRFVRSHLLSTIWTSSIPHSLFSHFNHNFVSLLMIIVMKCILVWMAFVEWCHWLVFLKAPSHSY